MSAIVISGDTSGAITLQAPAVSGNTTLNLPASSGTVLTQNSSAPANSLVVDASGNVLIGTSSALAPLTVYNSSNPYLALGNATFTTYLNQTTSDFHLYTGAAYPLRFGTNNTERMRIASDGGFSAVIPSGSTLYPAFMCRVWLNFNGTGTVAIRSSGNVTSITDNGTGRYTVNFTTALPDANYCAVSTNANNEGGCYSYSTSSIGVFVNNSAGSPIDSTDISFAVFR